MLTNMKHRTFLPFLKNPFIFSTFPHRETYVFRTRNIRFRIENLCFPHGNIKISPIKVTLFQEILLYALSHPEKFASHASKKNNFQINRIFAHRKVAT